MSSEAGLNAAIACYNGKTVAGSYTLSLSGDIGLTASTRAIANATANVILVIEGGGYTVDGQGTTGVRPFTIAADTVVTMRDMSITGGNSSSGGGIENSGTLTLLNSTLFRQSQLHPGEGGGLYVVGGSATVQNSTLSGNTGANGGGVALAADGVLMTVQNSTVSGNVASNNGGGFFVQVGATLNVIDSTVTANHADGDGGGVQAGEGQVRLGNTIVAGNTAGGTGPDVSGAFTSDDYNLVGDSSGASYTPGGHDLSGVDPQLGPLQDNGGPTWTHAVSFGSPAFNAGMSDLSVDQRGMPRPALGADDIGAYEQQECPDSWSVSNEVILNAAIACYNGKTAAGSYTLSLSGDIGLTASTRAIANATANVILVIEGGGYTVDGQGTTGVRPFTIAADTVVRVQNMTITGGNTGSGGGIQNAGTLTVINSTVRDNYADAAGGGIDNRGRLSVTNSTVSHNEASDESTTGSGGGINNSGTVGIVNSTISDNAADYGGAIYSQSALTINGSTFSGNSATDVGGAISSQGTLNIMSSTLSGNSTAGEGGGLYVVGGSATVQNSTLSGNTGANGGGVALAADGVLMTVQNSTVSGNVASNNGGGFFVHVGATLNVIDSTVTANHADGDGGGVQAGEGQVRLRNTIVSGNTAGGTGPDVSGAFTSNDYNLVGDSSGASYTPGGHDLSGVDPQLGPLQDNGGPTWTHAVPFGSPAFNMGMTYFAIDQRGMRRPALGADDIGAYEQQVCGDSWSVSTEAGLNAAIACYNGKTAAGSYSSEPERRHRPDGQHEGHC